MSRGTRPAGPRERRSGRGFTLLELLVVLAILGLIAAFATPRALKWLSGAKSDSARIQIENLSTAVDLYRLEVGSYPPTLEGLVAKPAGAERWNGPYLKKGVLPEDPWGRPFVYAYPGENGEYDLSTLGADGQVGGDGENADVTSWN